MKPMLIVVTEKDIQAAKTLRASPEGGYDPFKHCPIGQSLKRRGIGDYMISTGHLYIGPLRFRLPSRVALFINRFDNKTSGVKPFRFKIGG